MENSCKYDYIASKYNCSLYMNMSNTQSNLFKVQFLSITTDYRRVMGQEFFSEGNWNDATCWMPEFEHHQLKLRWKIRVEPASTIVLFWRGVSPSSSRGFSKAICECQHLASPEANASDARPQFWYIGKGEWWHPTCLKMRHKNGETATSCLQLNGNPSFNSYTNCCSTWPPFEEN